MPSNMNTMPVVFEAAADAPLSGKLLNFTARHVENEGIRGGFGNTADYIIGAPGQSRYRWKSVKQLAVAVVILEALEQQVAAYLAAAVPITHPAQMRPVKKARVRVTGRWLLPIVLVSVLSLFLL